MTESRGRVRARGVDHVGIGVPDVAEATRFFEEAFGAQVLFRTESHRWDAGEEVLAGERARLGTRPGARWIRSVHLRLGDGAAIELFEYEDEEKRSPPTASDLGIQHFAIYVDDIQLAREQVIRAGGAPLEGPTLLSGNEEGEGNSWLYTLAPWGGVVELVSFPSPQKFEVSTSLRRWKPPVNPDPPIESKEEP